MTGSPRIIGTVPIGTYVTVTHDGHPSDGYNYTVVAHQSPTGGIGGSAGTIIENVSGVRGTVSRYTRVTVNQS